MSVSLPKDRDGRTARECPNDDCSPGFFKVKPGTGLTNQKEAYCPYCRKAADPSDFTTKSQVEYAKKVMMAEAHEGIQHAVKDALGLDHSGRRQLVGGLINVSLELKSSTKPHVWPPWESVLKRDVLCPQCQLDQSV